MEKKISNSQSNLKKEEWNWRNQPAWLQAILQSYTVIKKAWYWHRDRNIHQLNKIESPEINPHTYGHLIFDKVGKNTQWRKDNLFNKWCWENTLRHKSQQDPLWSTSQNTGNKAKINKWDLIKLKSFCTTKETISKVKRQPSEWEKIIANEATDEELISKIYKQLLKLNSRKINNLIKKCAKELNRHFSKENIQMANKHEKILNITHY